MEMKVYFSTPFLNSPPSRSLIAAVTFDTSYGGVSFHSIMPLSLDNLENDDDRFDDNIKKIDSADIVTILIDPSIISSMNSSTLTATVLRESFEALTRGKLCNILVADSIYDDWKNDVCNVCDNQALIYVLLNEMSERPDAAFISSFHDNDDLIGCFFTGIDYFFSKDVDVFGRGSTTSENTLFTFSYSPFQLFKP